MKRTKLLAIPVLAAAVFAGCSAAPEAANKAPTLVGVKDIECIVNSEVDFLDGVAALDVEDGDITPAMDISVTPEVKVEDGRAYFGEVGTYTVSYSIKDSGGRTAAKRVFVDVVDRDTYKTFDMPEGFTAAVNGSAEIDKCGMETGAFKLEAHGGVVAEDIVLSRTYSVYDTYKAGTQCLFRYTINSNKAGKIKVMADGADCAEVYVNSGRNIFEFPYTPKFEKTVDEEGNVTDVTVHDVNVDICLGNLGDPAWTIESAECEYEQEENKEVLRTEEFTFAGKVQKRDDGEAVSDGVVLNTWATQNGKEAHFELTQLAQSDEMNAIWRSGMFINSEVPVRNGQRYKVSFKIARHNVGNVEVVFQNKQWNETQLGETRFVGDLFDGDALEGEVKDYIIDIDNINKEGSLWLRVQAGGTLNEITISDLQVTEVLGPSAKEVFAIDDYTSAGGEIKTEKGNVTFKVDAFSADGGQTAVNSPSFMVSGSGANYVLTFTASANKPIDMVVAVPVAGSWDPTILWQQIKLTDKPTVYTFACNNNDADRLHNIAWQFGSTANQQYSDVTITITDIRICLRDSRLDG